MPGRIKKLMLSEYENALKDSPDMFLISYSGIKSDDNTALRTKLGESGSSLMHVQNRIFRKALEKLELAELAKYVEGFSGVIYGEDVISAVKGLEDYVKEKKVEILGGYFEGEFLSPDEVIALSKIPSKEVLYSQVMQMVQAPLTGVVNALQAVTRKLVMTVKEIEKTK